MNLFKTITKRIKSFLSRHQSEDNNAVDEVQDTQRWTSSQPAFRYTEKPQDLKPAVTPSKAQSHKTTAERRKAISDYYETHSIDDTVDLVHEPSNFVIGCFFEFHKMTKLEWVAQQNAKNNQAVVTKSPKDKVLPESKDKKLPAPIRRVSSHKVISDKAYSDQMIDIANYYATHTIDQTKKEFHSNNTTVVNAFKETHNGVSKQSWALNGTISDYYEKNSLTATIEKFNLPSPIIQSIFAVAHSGVSKEEWQQQQLTFNQDDIKSISDYYAHHSLQETIQKYHVSDTIVKNAFEQLHQGKTKLEWRNEVKAKQNKRPYIKGKIYNPDIKPDIIAYRKSHSVNETSEFFSMSIERIDNIYQQAVVQYYQTHSIGQTAVEFGVNNQYITAAFGAKYHQSKETFMQSKAMKPIADYYLTHSIEKTANVYNISKTTVSRYFKIVYGVTKREWSYQNQKKRKVGTNGNN